MQTRSCTRSLVSGSPTTRWIGAGSASVRGGVGRTSKQCAGVVLVVLVVLAFLDCPGNGNGPTEAISGRLEHPGGSALSSRDTTKSSCALRTSQ